MDRTKKPAFVRLARKPLPRTERSSERDRPSNESRPNSGRSAAAGVRPSGGQDQDLHTRIVVPRHGRVGEPDRSIADVEVREIRYGATSRGPYLRIVPRQRRFTMAGPGHLEATRLGSVPRGAIERAVASVKGVALGNPFATSQLVHERLSKVKALAIFSSDALSSSAYATEEILLILVLAGSVALHNVLQIAAVIALLLAIVTISYRQTIKAYPSGGGAYIVAHENLGRTPGLTAAAALLVDYVLTVTVSVAAGVAAVTSAFPDLQDFRVLIGLVVVAFITLGNLRGVREAGSLFALPTYLFIFSMAAVIAVGFVKVAIGEAPGSLLHGAPPEESVAATQSLTLFLVLRAFSSGCAALTGIEAISNGVPAFKSPESQNARATLTAMAAILAFLFLGITFLSSRFGFVPSHGETIVSELGREVLGKNVLYYGYQAATAMVLFLAANTSYADFPRLSAILAKDKFMPRQFSFRGDRLAFSNGIMFLAVAASVLLILFGGEVSNLIPLYAVGVFVSFTLSQSGMVRHWLRLRESGWRASLVINAVGAVGTGVVAVIIAGTKFASGAWIAILMMAALMLMFTLIRRHYDWFEKQTHVDESETPVGLPTAVAVEAGSPRDCVIVPVDGINKITLGAIRMAREISGDITAVHLTDERELAEEFRDRWKRSIPDVPLLLIESPYRAFAAPIIAYVESVEKNRGRGRTVLLLPTFAARHWWERALHSRNVQSLKRLARALDRVRVVEFPYYP